MKVYIVLGMSNDGFEFQKPFTAKKEALHFKKFIDEHPDYGDGVLCERKYPISKKGILDAIVFGTDKFQHPDLFDF